MKISIRRRIYFSFMLLVSLFVVTGVVTIITLNSIKKQSARLSDVIDPSIQGLDEFKRLMLESKMYTTNWVFLRYNQRDKDLLKRLHDSDYVALKARLSKCASEWTIKPDVDTLNRVYRNFEKLLAIEKNIMGSLQAFSDYDDPVIKLEAERKIEDEVLPRTVALISDVSQLKLKKQVIRKEETDKLESASMNLRAFIIVLAITILVAGVLLSVYMTKLIVAPINKIRYIINGLGKGIIRKIDQRANRDEIAEMIHSVNNLSENLQATATFAHEVGARNFEIPFQPLSEEDTLGKALIAMRDNLKTSEKELMAIATDLTRRNKDLEQFTYIVSHNLRAPVANIIGLSAFLNNDNISLDKKQKIVEGLSFSVKNLNMVITDLNDILQKKQLLSEKNETVSFSDIVENIKSGIGHVMENEMVTFNCDFSAADKMFTVKSYLHSIFYNLILNGIKFRQPGKPPVITIKTFYSEDKLSIEFRDNGKGIDLLKNREYLFGLYKRFDTTVEGKGMGLFMTKTQVETLGGRIDVESEVDKGTAFTIAFPV